MHRGKAALAGCGHRAAARMSIKFRRYIADAPGFEESLNELTSWDAREDPSVLSEVRTVVEAVREGGDKAVLDFAAEFDNATVSSICELKVTKQALLRSWERISRQQREALELAADRIRSFHASQVEEGFEIADDHGNLVGQRVSPLSRVGVYVPGGSASYPSTVLMTVIPARVANVDDIIVCTPPTREGNNDLLFASLHLSNPNEIYCIGGAHAIAAMAQGTESIPSVDKIVGPGGPWVAAAKRLVFGQVGIDSIAGPSEVLVIADGTASARWVALDLMSQAEHDVSAQAILICLSESFLASVELELNELLLEQPRQEVISESIRRRGAAILVSTLEQATQIANRIAPEHLQLAVANPREIAKGVRNAGAIFLGASSSEVLGDYVAGPSHVLPTYGTAKYASPLGVYDFVKRTSIVELQRRGIDNLSRAASVLAEGEGLLAHAAAARARIPGMDHNRDRTPST